MCLSECRSPVVVKSSGRVLNGFSNQDPTEIMRRLTAEIRDGEVRKGVKNGLLAVNTIPNLEQDTEQKHRR